MKDYLFIVLYFWTLRVKVRLKHKRLHFILFGFNYFIFCLFAETQDNFFDECHLEKYLQIDEIFVSKKDCFKCVTKCV